MADYLKIPEIARRLDVSEKTARRYIKAGALSSTFIGGAYRVTEEDLEAFLHGAEVKPEDVSPKGPRRSSLEPSLFNGIEGERRGYPYSWMGDVLARTIDGWAQAVGAQRDPKYSNFIAVSCFDVLWFVLRHDAPGDTLEERVRDAEERDQRIRVAEKVWELAKRAQDHYVDSKGAEEAEVQEIERRREEIRRRTRALSA